VCHCFHVATLSHTACTTISSPPRPLSRARRKPLLVSCVCALLSFSNKTFAFFVCVCSLLSSSRVYISSGTRTSRQDSSFTPTHRATLLRVNWPTHHCMACRIERGSLELCGRPLGARVVGRKKGGAFASTTVKVIHLAVRWGGVRMKVPTSVCLS
jgi:hypothetical protein